MTKTTTMAEAMREHPKPRKHKGNAKVKTKGESNEDLQVESRGVLGAGLSELKDVTFGKHQQQNVSVETVPSGVETLDMQATSSQLIKDETEKKNPLTAGDLEIDGSEESASMISELLLHDQHSKDPCPDTGQKETSTLADELQGQTQHCDQCNITASVEGTKLTGSLERDIVTDGLPKQPVTSVVEIDTGVTPLDAETHEERAVNDIFVQEYTDYEQHQIHPAQQLSEQSEGTEVYVQHSQSVKQTDKLNSEDAEHVSEESFSLVKSSNQVKEILASDTCVPCPVVVSPQPPEETFLVPVPQSKAHDVNKSEQSMLVTGISTSVLKFSSDKTFSAEEAIGETQRLVDPLSASVDIPNLSASEVRGQTLHVQEVPPGDNKQLVAPVGEGSLLEAMGSQTAGECSPLEPMGSQTPGECSPLEPMGSQSPGECSPLEPMGSQTPGGCSPLKARRPQTQEETMRLNLLYPELMEAGNRFKPRSVEELQNLYYNLELQNNPQFIETFIQKEEKKAGHEFSEILMNYFRARKSLLNVEEDLKTLQQNYEQVQAELWIVTRQTFQVEGQCGDGNRATKLYTYEQCKLNKDALASLSSCLQSIRSEMQGDLALFAYSAQMSRLQVESYIHSVFMSCSFLRDMPRSAPVTAMECTREDVQPHVEKLKECISVLFTFHRKPTSDTEFVENIRRWTERLVSALLRVATFKDHLFVLNHILRSPAGVGQWAASLVQIPAPASLALQTTIGSPVLDHAVTCMATVLQHVRAREDFMCHMRVNVTNSSLQLERAWILVDSDGEEDEDPAQAWLYLHENDVVSLLQQLPMEAIFAHLLQAPMDISGNVQYDVRRCTEPAMMVLFAFCTTWIMLLGEGLDTYSKARYRQLNKRLGRLIRQTVSFVSDHWLNFKTYYGQLASSASLEKLQLEFDQLFMRATYTILTAQKLGSWQFMADMPFTCLSAGNIWRLLWLLQQAQPVNLDALPPVEKCKEDMTDIESRRQLADTLQNLPRSESEFLLTTFANMAAARPLEEDEFIECVTLQVFEIAYICDHTREFCFKIGRQLLSSIIQKHPTALSMLLRKLQVVMPQLGKMALYLFQEMPASIWCPQDPDMLLLRQWLLNFDLDSTENELARLVLERMNWDIFSETGKLVLDIRLHRQVALLLNEAYVKYISERKANFLIIEGMKQMAAFVSQKSSREQVFNNWVWALALRLKLHRESTIMQSRAAATHHFQPPALQQDQHLLPLAMATRNKNPLACYLALTMTDVGHDTGQFLSSGLDMLLTLATSNQFSTVIHVLSCVVPLFINTSQYLLDNESFQKILQMIIAADDNILKVTKLVLGAEFPGVVTRQFTQMMQAMISARLDGSEALPVLLFWIRAIFKVAKFFTDRNCCYIVDNLVRWGHLQKGAREKIDALFRDYFNQHLSEAKSRSGFLMWVGGSTEGQPSLMDQPSLPEFGWLAMQVLHVESTFEVESGIWPGLQHELLSKPGMSLETALKNVQTHLRPSGTPSVSRLSIYRWAQQALDTHPSHPLLPIMWQRFFSFFLGRSSMGSQMPARASVGEQFFQTMAMSSMLKKMKKKLADCAQFHLNKLQEDDKQGNISQQPPMPTGEPGIRGAASESETDSQQTSPLIEESPRYVGSHDFHQQLARLYQTYGLWLEEPRLHGGDLYLPALPLQYEPSRLMQIFMPMNNPWLEFVDFEQAQYEISCTAAAWRNVVSDRPQMGSPVHSRRRGIHEQSATDRIRQRLQRYPAPKPPPPLHPISPPVPDIPPSLLLDKMAAVHLLDADLSILTEFTKFFSLRAAQQFAVDGIYLDLLPGQYSNIMKMVQVSAECRSRVNPLHRCSGPATIPIRVEERELNPIVQRKIDENRAEYKQLIIEAVLPPPQNVCSAAVHVENAITLVIKMSQKTADERQLEMLQDLACTLFFHLAMQVTAETNFYLPTKQFFSSCIEILGKEFVSRVPQQTPLLLQFCLDNSSLAEVVSPHFVPNNAPENFVPMYEQLIAVLQQQNLHLVFTLLTKFDVWAWLEEYHPNAADKKRFLEVLGSALMSCGAEPSAKTKLVFDVYVGHLRCVLGHQFPNSLTSILLLLLEGSSSEALHTSCWEMFLMECCNPHAGPEARPVTQAYSRELVEGCSNIPMSIQELQDLQQWLGAYFMHQRTTQQQALNFGLYPSWSRYVPYLSSFMGLLSRSLVTKVMVNLQEWGPYPAMQLIWEKQLVLWRAWLQPVPHVPAGITGIENIVMQPWTEADSTVAVTMVEEFKSAVLFMHTKLEEAAPEISSTVLSLVLMHYMISLSHQTTPPHVSLVFIGVFADLPWERMKPDPHLLETMAQLKERCAACCFQLLGHLIPKVDWPQVFAYFKAYHDPQASRQIQASLLVLLVQFYSDSTILELPGIVQLLTLSESFDWTGLTVDSFRHVSSWFLNVCQPQWLLAQRSSLPAVGFRLMRNAAEFTIEASQSWTAEMSFKRVTYIHCVAQQLCQVTYLTKADLEALQTVLVNLLSEIESVESAVADVRCQEEESLDLMKEILSLLNNSNPDGNSQELLLQTLCQWLHSSPHSILLTPCIKASSRCLASLRQMAVITETCIQVYFIACSDEHASSGQENTKGWGHILSVFQVPELNTSDYVTEALKSGAYLMLYAMLLHKRPLCRSLEDEAHLMEDIILWSSQVIPSINDEAKLFLWWHEFLQIWLRQLDFAPSSLLCINAVQRLIRIFHQMGEDRASSGFFGVIGLGKRSQFSLQFRLGVRTLAAFLSSQLLSDTAVRLNPSDSLSELPIAKQCRIALTSLRSSRMYGPLKDSVENMIGFVHKTDHTVRQALDLMKELVTTLYPQCDYLTATFL